MIFTAKAELVSGEVVVTDGLTGAVGTGTDFSLAMADLAAGMEARYRELAGRSRLWPHETRKIDRLRLFFGAGAF